MKEYINVMLPKWKLMLPTILRFSLFIIALIIDPSIWNNKVSTALFIIAILWTIIDAIKFFKNKKNAK